MNDEPTVGQVYEYTDHKNERARLVVVSVSDTHVEYKLLWGGVPGRYVYPLTRRTWNEKPDGLKLVGTLKLTSED